MARVIAFKCKTPGCEAWFPIKDMPDDTSRNVSIVLRLDEAPRSLECPDCKKVHSYAPADKIKVQADERPSIRDMNWQ